MLVDESVDDAFEKFGYGPATIDRLAWIDREIRSMGTVKIASFSLAQAFTVPLTGDGNHPYLMIVAAENGETDDSWYRYVNLTQSQRNVVDTAIAANKLIVVAGYRDNANGRYTRHPGSSGCKGLDAGCLWAEYDVFGNGGDSGGTSLSTQQFAAAVASVLAVFPDTTPQNLAKFAKASAKRTGNGIPALLAQSGGIGVADFTSMGRTIAALRSLPTGGRTDVTINGQSVSLGNRDLVLSFAQSRSARYFTVSGNGDEEEPERISFRVVPNGEDAAMAFTTLREGAFFASVGVGKYDSFFGYRRGHGEVLGSEYAAGHENLFLHLADVRSSGGHLVSRAEGRSLGLTAEQAFRPADHLAVTLSVNLEKFLGGEADIPFGEVRLDQGQWNRRLGLAAEYTAYGGTKLGLNAGALLPNGDKPETHVGFRLHIAVGNRVTPVPPRSSRRAR